MTANDSNLMDAARFTDAFFRIEQKLQLFADDGADFNWWDAVRADVYWLLYQELTGVAVPQPTRATVVVRIARMLWRHALRLRLWWRLRTQSFDVVVLRAPRQRRGGRLVDAALDQVASVCPGRQLIIDTHPHFYHRDVGVRHTGDASLPAVFDALVAELQRELTVPRNVSAFRDFVAHKVVEFVRARAQYERLFALARPRLVLVCQNGFEKALFSAAKRLAIPVAEVQHGLINHAHPAYSYPPAAEYGSRTAFPTCFLTFSEYWTRACYYPARRCIAIGNDDFYVETSTKRPAAGDVLFISADIYHGILLPRLREAAAALPKHRFKYKLHPNQQSDFERIRQELSQVSNVEVVDGHTAARTLLPTTSVVVVVQSTVAQEALQAGKRLCVIPVLNYTVHADLFDLPQVTVTPSVASLIAAVEAPLPEGPPPVFFNRFDRARAQRLLRQLFDGEIPAELDAPSALLHASNQ